MILVTCTIASFVTQKGAQNVARQENSEIDNEDNITDERILIPIRNPETTDELINLSVIVKNPKNKNSLFGLNVINDDNLDSGAEANGKKILEKAAITASATDNHLTKLLRYDLNIVNAINSTVREHNITDLVLGLHVKQDISESFLGDLTEGILSKCNTTTLVYKPVQPISTIIRQIVIIPKHAEKEIGFPFWLLKVWNIARNTGAKLMFYGSETTLKFIQEIYEKHPIEAEFQTFTDWDDFLILTREIKTDDNLIVILSRKNKPSYHANMVNIHTYLNKYFQQNSFILVYPMQTGVNDDGVDLNNPSLIEPIGKIDEIGKTIARLFKKK
jgi:nucleotide-binding universal stress UspA family protein